MKKKIILILSIMAIAICIFALTVSASNYIDLSNMEYSNNSYVSYFDNYSDATSNVEEVFGVFFVDEGSSSQDSMRKVGFVNIEWWHSYLTTNHVSDFMTFCTAIDNLISIGAVTYDCNLYQFMSAHYDHMYNTYLEYVAEITAPSYEDGHRDGYNEGHKFGYDMGYGAGLIEGETEFKESVEYQNSLDIARAEGRSEGKMEFVKSKEYANALSIEYDKGYTDGLNEDGYEASDIIGMALGVGMIAALAIICIMAFNKKKRKRY